MDKVGIVTDSNVCLPEDIAQRLKIRIVPIWLVFGAKVYRDGVDITPDHFYAALREGGDLPTTSSPSPEDYLEAFVRVRRVAESILVVTYSSQLGMAYESAIGAKRAVDEYPVEVIDSRTATMAQGFVVLEAARAASGGADLEEVVAIANRAIPRVGFVATLETLKYLHRAGRVPAVAEWIGSALKLRMILGNRDGGVGVLGATRTRSQTIKRMLGELERRVGYRKLDVAVFHADALTRALALRRAVADRFDCRELLTVEFTPVMGAHTGPDVVGLAYHVLESR